MARIIYGVAGEGMGHAIRSMPVIKELSKKHKIKIFAGGRAYNYLSGYFKDVNKIGYLNIVYFRNSVANLTTFLFNFIKFPIIFFINLKILRQALKFKPHIIISDFEPFTSYLSPFLNIPNISITNQNIQTETNAEMPKKFKLTSLISKTVIKIITFNSDHFIIYSFFKTKKRKNNTFIFKPALRSQIMKLKPTNGNHILVYQTSKSNKKLLKILKKVNENFIIYGFSQEKKEDNLTFRQFNEKIFFNDLANCKAIITNGGFSLIADALYLQKPILSQPIKYQFEQIFNAVCIKKLGFGEFHEKISKERIEKFISNILAYRKQLKNYKRYNNSKIMDKIQEIISSD